MAAILNALVSLSPCWWISQSERRGCERPCQRPWWKEDRMTENKGLWEAVGFTERKRKRWRAGSEGERLMGNTPILQRTLIVLGIPHLSSSPPLHVPPSHLLPLALTTFHVCKCFIISAFVVKSLRLEKKKRTHQWTSHARLLFFFISVPLSLASAPCFTHGWVWQVVFRSNDTLLLAGWGRTNTQGIACVMCHHIYQEKHFVEMEAHFIIFSWCHKKLFLLILMAET